MLYIIVVITFILSGINILNYKAVKMKHLTVPRNKIYYKITSHYLKDYK